MMGPHGHGCEKAAPGVSRGTPNWAWGSTKTFLEKVRHGQQVGGGTRDRGDICETGGLSEPGQCGVHSWLKREMGRERHPPESV